MQWFRFYSEALDDPKVQRLPGDLFKAWVNLLCLANLQAERGTLPSVEDIAFRLRLSDDDAGELLADLARRGLLEPGGASYRIHGWESRQYRSDADPTAAERKRRQRDRERDKSNVTRDISVTAENVTRTDTDTDTEKKQKQSQTQTQKQTAAAPPIGGVRVRAAPKPSLLNADERTAFEEWYGRYPNKQHRPEAERAWAKLRPDHELLTQLIGDIETRKLGRKWSEGYIEHPATYLNNRVWEDDIEPVRVAPVRATHTNGTGFSSDDAFSKNLARLRAVGRVK